MSREKKLVWLPKEIAEQVEFVKSPEQLKEIIDGYTDRVKGELDDQVQYMEDCIIQYKGFLLSAQKRFKTESNKMLEDAYNAWEEWDKKMPSLDKQVDKMLKRLEPLEEKINTVNQALRKLDFYELNKFVELLDKFEQMDDSTKQMFFGLLGLKQQVSQEPVKVSVSLPEAWS
jgi:DNA repair ATPase RecN